jgi:neutral ceramidase
MRILKIAFAGIIYAAMLWAAPMKALELKAGTAKGVITPSDPLGRITVMGRPIKGVNHDIYARVLVLDDGAHKIVFVTYDLNCLDVATPIIRSRALHELGIGPAYLIMMATHNHAAPIQINPKNFDYGRWLAGRIFGLIQDAIKDEGGPVKVHFGTEAGKFIRSDARYLNVYGGPEPVDDEVEVLKITRGDKVKALLVSQATHPAVATFSQVDPSHPGYAMEMLEKDFPGATALYADGCGGDQFPSGAPALITTAEKVAHLASELSGTVEHISKGDMIEVTGRLNSELKVQSLPLRGPISYEEAKRLGELKHVTADTPFEPYPEKGRDYNWIKSLLKHYQDHVAFPTHSDDYICTDEEYLVKELPTPREFPCRFEEAIVATIGQMVLVSMQGEVCAPIGKEIKEAWRSKRPVMVCAYMGEHNLYIPTRKLVEINAYQSRVIQEQYASPVGWSPDVGDVLVKGIGKMIEEMIQ